MANTNTKLTHTSQSEKNALEEAFERSLEKSQLIKILEERINALESRNLFQDDVIEQLSEELAVHQHKIALMQEQIQLVANRLKDAGELSSNKDMIEPPPPHY